MQFAVRKTILILSIGISCRVAFYPLGTIHWREKERASVVKWSVGRKWVCACWCYEVPALSQFKLTPTPAPWWYWHDDSITMIVNQWHDLNDLVIEKYLFRDSYTRLIMPTGDQADVCNSCLLPYNSKERTPKVRVTEREDSLILSVIWNLICYLLLSDPEVLSHLLQELFGAVHVPRQCDHLSSLRTNYTGREVRISSTKCFSMNIFSNKHIINGIHDLDLQRLEEGWVKSLYVPLLFVVCLLGVSFRTSKKK